jgi:hypothetical protein
MRFGVGDIEPDTRVGEDMVPAGLVWCAGVIAPVGERRYWWLGGDREISCCATT